ncbi:MAG: acyltransferase [Pedobacter sp.]
MTKYYFGYMNVQNNNKDLLNTKQHFELLDGLRGVAAVAVVIFHFMEFVFPDYKDNFIAHAYLAVDFFFCLSGFVIAYAYHSKISNLGFVAFLKLRLIRLHPLVIIGSIIGLIAFIFDPFSKLFQAHADQTILMFITSCFMIPYPLVPERYFNLFHLNPPTWSLFWEYIANIVYAAFLFKIRNKGLLALTLIAAITLFYVASNYKFLGVGFGGDNFLAGGARVFYSFLAGIVVYRLQWRINNNLGFITMTAFLLIAFLFPFMESANWLIDPIIVTLYFPFLVVLGAGSKLKTRYSTICRFSGEISYPLYMIHYPFLWIFLSYIETHKPLTNEMILITFIGVPFLILIAYYLMLWIDIPLRKYLKKQWLK